MAANVYIGTSGYSYADWTGPVYPAGTASKDYFAHYCHLFLFSELNFSYYTIPKASNLQKLCSQSPEAFRFSIKAHQSLTHQRTEDWETQAKAYQQGITPLIESGKLATILFQFPFSFHYTISNRQYIDSLIHCFERYPLHFEFRNSQWLRTSVEKGLTERGAGFTASDSPRLRGLPEFKPIVSSNIAYARFHGRNSTKWWTGDNTSRYDYRYSEQELTEICPILKEMAQKSTMLLIAFNNHYKGQAVDNGLQLAALLNKDQALKIILPDSYPL